MYPPSLIRLLILTDVSLFRDQVIIWTGRLKHIPINCFQYRMSMLLTQAWCSMHHSGNIISLFIIFEFSSNLTSLTSKKITLKYFCFQFFRIITNARNAVSEIARSSEYFPSFLRGISCSFQIWYFLQVCCYFSFI